MGIREQLRLRECICSLLQADGVEDAVNAFFLSPLPGEDGYLLTSRHSSIEAINRLGTRLGFTEASKLGAWVLLRGHIDAIFRLDKD